MRRAAVLLIASGLSALAQGLPARPQPADYPSRAESKGLVVAAEVMDPEQVQNEFSTPLVSRYQVMEVALYPQKGESVDVVLLDFGLRVDGRLIRPATPDRIAARNQRRANERRKDITLWPAVGVSTGSWGTGTNVGVGVGVGDAPPGPGSTDRDRRVMETELEDRGLQDGLANKPVAGYLYFPIGEVKSQSAELIYQLDDREVRVPVTLHKKK